MAKKMKPLHQLAQQAGIEITWRDVNGVHHTIADETLAKVLTALGLPAATDTECRQSLEMVSDEDKNKLPPLVTVISGMPIVVPHNAIEYRLIMENGRSVSGHTTVKTNGVEIPAIEELGYHRLILGDTITTIAVAPEKAITIEDIAGRDKKLWGLAVQLYSLKRQHDGGIGDFTALAEFAEHASKLGAAAIGISPVHALFSADVTRYGPYAPSNRAALNVMHIALDNLDLKDDDDNLIDWPRAAIWKIQSLREAFKTRSDNDGFKVFRETIGIALQRHAIFEAIAQKFTKTDPNAQDWRRWPVEYQHPKNPEIEQFCIENRDEIDFQLWLQFKADQGLASAHEAACRQGAKIGLITDLAVGTDPSGSHSWVRQNEVLQGLEIGAPPDLLNREGQRWGITAFSPRGLRLSGYSGFIEMLRHALRHSGGVRIDHVMGLARLWVIPSGSLSADGAYLSMPVDDLLRLVCLESHRHRAIILGEDLGTLPDGFGDKLNRAGIAGLRVLWFERQEKKFILPDQWTNSAVAMTSTHDLPTVAGWWQGRDIEWRHNLNWKGDSEPERDEDRAELWSTFQKTSASSGSMPDKDDLHAVTKAAVLHLASAASSLALIPIEDALALVEQPNLPGTTYEHPNWRRRLPGDAEQIFSDPNFIDLITALNKSRQGNA